MIEPTDLPVGAQTTNRRIYPSEHKQPTDGFTRRSTNESKLKIMAAFVIVDISIFNPQEYEEYKKLTPGTLAPFEGKFLTRGGRTMTLEGDWEPERLVILEFPTFDKAKEWYHSDLYSRAKLIRQKASTAKMIIAEGIH